MRDIGSLLDWIESQDNLDSSRVVVYGGSYGLTACNLRLLSFFGRAKDAVLMLLLLRWLHVSSRIISLS